MDPRLLKHYNRELQYIREMGAEFADQFPKIAGRLGLDGLECADPYVERLLEGFAFLAARVQLKLDAQFPVFSRHLLEMVMPHYLCPTPSMAITQLHPDLTEGALGDGYVVPRDTALFSALGKGDQTACEYRTAHDLTLWPLEIVEAAYHGTKSSLGGLGLSDIDGARAGIRIKLRTTAGLTFAELPLDRLCLHILGRDAMPTKIHEQILVDAIGFAIQPAQRAQGWHQRFATSCIEPVGFGEEHALLPFSPQSFQGHRLLHEYFAFAKRFLFFELTGINSALRRVEGDELDVVILLKRPDADLEQTLTRDNFGLFCTPAVNLFPMRADRIHLNERDSEFHVVADRTRPMDFEVYSITDVVGVGSGSGEETEFLPFYATVGRDGRRDSERAYYSAEREPRLLSSKQAREAPRSSYIGSETYISLVDSTEAPYRSTLRQVAVGTLCTNRDLPLHIPVGRGDTDFTLETGAPVESIRCVVGPSRPRATVAEGESTWRLISHLSLNYLSLIDTDEEQGATALRELLTLYTDDKDAVLRTQIEGIKSITSTIIHRRLPGTGPIAFGRGLEITITCDDAAFEGSGIALLGAVLDVFFARYVSMNSFTETVVRSLDRGEIMRWPARVGRRHAV